jgi:hypothetical protein
MHRYLNGPPKLWRKCRSVYGHPHAGEGHVIHIIYIYIYKKEAKVDMGPQCVLIWYNPENMWEQKSKSAEGLSTTLELNWDIIDDNIT